MKIKEYIEDLNETTVINTTVLVETLNKSVGTNDEIKKLYKDLHNKNQEIQLTDKDYLKSLEINSWYGNSINYSDCTIIKTMMDMHINNIVSFDNAFKKINSFNVITCI